MSTNADSPICLRTQEYFRDPLLAKDGRSYERGVITRCTDATDFQYHAFAI